MGKKRFLNKKKSATFSLVYRDSAEEVEGTVRFRQFTRVDGGDSYVPGFSEDDPRLQPLNEEDDDDEEDLRDVDDSRFDDADEDDGNDAVEVRQQTHPERTFKLGEKPSGIGISEKVRRELIELGFPDDGYDYNQHMRRVGATIASGSFVPATRQPVPLRADIKAYDASKVDVQAVSASKEAADDVTDVVRSHVRLVRKPSPQVGGLDAEVIAALESSDGSQFDSADELEDEFVVMASTGGEEQIHGLLNERATTSSSAVVGCPSLKSDEESDAEELNDDEDEEHNIYVPERSRTEKPVRLLDEQFEKLALNEYDDYNNSDLDEDDPLAKGHAGISQFSSVLADFLNEKDISSKKYESPAELSNFSSPFDGAVDRGMKANSKLMVTERLEDPVVKKTLELGGYVSDNEVIALEESGKDVEEWDCETVVSTFSNLDNHPARIGSFEKPRLRSKLGELEKSAVIRLGGIQPGKVVRDKQGSKSAKKDTFMTGSRAGETLEEKKARKGLIKEQRREARLNKKATKICFREDSQRAQRGAATMGPNAIHLP